MLVLIPVVAAVLVEIDKLQSDMTEYDAFGYSIAASGDRVVVGAYEDNHQGIKSGAAHVFLNSSRTKLIANDTERYDRFARAVAMSSNLVVAGAYGDGDAGAFAGAAYVFRTVDGGQTYTQTQKFKGKAAFDYFGVDVAVEGDTVVIGAYGDDDGRGATYVFRTTDGGLTFVQTQQLTASDAAPNDWFGRAVAMSSKYLVVGSTGDSSFGLYSGAVYVFSTDGEWYTERQKLFASDATDYQWFGRAVAVASNLLVVGGYGDNQAAPAAGAAYIFRTTGETFVQTQKLIASDAAANDNFGRAVDMSPSRVVVGASRNDAPGQVYSFRNDGLNFTEIEKLVGSDAAPNDRFGFSVAISCDIVAIGAYWNDQARSQSGEAYVYRAIDDRLNFSSWNGLGGYDVALEGDLFVVGSHDAVYVMHGNSTQKLLTQTLVGVDGFGRAVSVSGDKIVVGALGAAYVYIKEDVYVETHKFMGEDDFGFDVAVSPKFIVVGAQDSVYVFDAVSFSQRKKLTGEGDFGRAVAVFDDFIVVGAPDSEDGAGAVYVYNGGSFVEKLMARDAAPHDKFGTAVAVSPYFIVAGAVGNDDAGDESGSAYVFDASTFAQVQKLTSGDAKSHDQFGRDVAVSGNVVVAGARGAAYTYCTAQGGSFEQVHRLADDPAENFGVTVATDGHLIVVGATNGTEDGTAYAFSFEKCEPPSYIPSTSSTSHSPAAWFLLLEFAAFAFMVVMLVLVFFWFFGRDPWFRDRSVEKSEFEMNAQPPIAPVADLDDYCCDLDFGQDDDSVDLEQAPADAAQAIDADKDAVDEEEPTDDSAQVRGDTSQSR